jgi:hypothetical protein
LLVAVLVVAELALGTGRSAAAPAALLPAPAIPAELGLAADGGYTWVGGKIKTYISDAGDLDSIVYYYVNYKRLSGGRLHIRYVVVTNPKAVYWHMWAYHCYNTCGAHKQKSCQIIPTDTWVWAEPNWTVDAGHRFKIWITNSYFGYWDCSGIAGETWPGYVTLR